MTKVARLFEEEKIEYANQAVNKVITDNAYSLAQEMLSDNEDIIKIMKYSKLSKKEILKIQKEIQKKL